MERKSKKTAAIFLIVLGLILFIRYLIRFDSQDVDISRVVIMVCASIFIVLGILSLRNVIK